MKYFKFLVTLEDGSKETIFKKTKIKNLTHKNSHIQSKHFDRIFVEYPDAVEINSVLVDSYQAFLEFK